MMGRTKACRTALVLGVLGLFLAAGAPTALAQQVSEDTLFGASVGSGARALAMGGAFIAIADDATASSWNPAGLAVLEKAEASLVWQPHSSFRTEFAAFDFRGLDRGVVQREHDDAYAFKRDGNAIDFASLSVPFRAGKVKVVPQVNFQRAVDFGLDSKIEEFTFNGSFTGIPGVGGSIPYTGRGSLESNSSGGLDIWAFSVGVGVTEKLYVGGSVNLWRNGSNGTRSLSSNLTILGTQFPSTTEFEGEEEYEGTNFNLGVMLKPTAKFRVGAVFKSAFDLDHTATSTRQVNDFTGRATITRTEVGTIKWPRTFGVGVAVLPTDTFTLSADFTQSNWSNATYDVAVTVNETGSPQRTGSGVLQFPTGFDPADPTGSLPTLSQVDTQQIRVGAEYVIQSPGLLGLTVLPLRIGGFTDRQYFRDTPDGGNVDHTGLSAGFGLVWSRITLDFAYVRESGDYHCCDFTVTRGGQVASQVSADADKFSSNRFYVSTIVRFK